MVSVKDAVKHTEDSNETVSTSKVFAVGLLSSELSSDSSFLNLYKQQEEIGKEESKEEKTVPNDEDHKTS